MAWLVLTPLLLWLYPRFWLLPVALALPVVEFWLFWGLGSSDSDGFENWGLLALPVLCLLSLGAGVCVLLLRRDHDRRRAAGSD